MVCTCVARHRHCCSVDLFSDPVSRIDVNCTLPPIIMVQWNMGLSPTWSFPFISGGFFHWTMIMMGFSRDRKGTEFTISHVSTARFGRGFGWHGHSISSCLRWLPSHECCATAGRGRPWYYYLHAAELEGTKWTSLFLPKTRLQNCRHSDVEADAGERKCQGGFGTWWLSGLFQSSEKQQL